MYKFIGINVKYLGIKLALYVNKMVSIEMVSCYVVYVHNNMWLDIWKLVQIAQELKSILLPNIKATF